MAAARRVFVVVVLSRRRSRVDDRTCVATAAFTSGAECDGGRGRTEQRQEDQCRQKTRASGYATDLRWWGYFFLPPTRRTTSSSESVTLPSSFEASTRTT